MSPVISKVSMLGTLYFQNSQPRWWRAWNSNLLFYHLLLLLDSVRISECFSILYLQFILHHDPRLYQHVKDDSTGCSHHAVSHVWQGKGSEKLWWGCWEEREGATPKGPEGGSGKRGFFFFFVNLLRGNVLPLFVQDRFGELLLLCYWMLLMVLVKPSTGSPPSVPHILTPPLCPSYCSASISSWWLMDGIKCGRALGA